MSIDEMWPDIHRNAVRQMIAGDVEAAFDELSRFLIEAKDADSRIDALGLRASIKEDWGNFSSAKEDLLEAFALSDAGTYQRYTLSLALGGICEKISGKEEAVDWYIQAIQTARLDPTTSGGSAIASLLNIKLFSELSKAEQDLCEKVARQSWLLLQLPGEPNVSNLTETARSLIEAGSRRRP